jgi:hypothetical protein
MNNEDTREQRNYNVEQILWDVKRANRRSNIKTALIFVPMLISWLGAYFISDKTEPYKIIEVIGYSQLKEIDSDCNVLLHYDTVIYTDWDLVENHGSVETVKASFYGLVNNDSLVFVMLDYDSLEKFQNSSKMLVSLSYSNFFPSAIGDTLKGGYHIMKIRETLQKPSSNGKQMVSETNSSPYIFEDKIKMDERLELLLIIGPFAFLMLIIIISNVVDFVSWIGRNFGKEVSIAVVVLMLFFVFACLFTIFNA